MKGVRSRGFTLIELLVVVAIIALLIAILLPSLGKAREMTKRTTCAANLKAQGTACAIYAAQFGDRVPNDGSTAGGINWLWDEYRFWGDSLMALTPAGGATTDNMSEHSPRKLFYCPSNTGQDANELWAFNTGNGIRVMGYGYFNDRTTFSGTINFNPARNGNQQRYNKKFSSQDGASALEMVFDAMIQSGSGGSFTEIHGGWAGTHTTSHLKGNLPAGQNILYCDAHVDWKTFTQSKSSYVTAGPLFWVVNP